MLTAGAGGPGDGIGLSIADAAGRVERLGFVVVNGAAPGRPGGANLVVALRSSPTQAHFDPELIQHWESVGGRGHLVERTRHSPLPLRRPYAWGTIRVVDRLNMANAFLSFGGTVRAEAVGPAETLVIFSSAAPIVRWTGHSQEPDPLAGEVGAFFAEIKVPIDFEPEAEARVAAATPVTLYAVLLQRLERRNEASESLRTGDEARAIEREAQRIRESSPADWAAASELARSLGLAER